MFKFFYYGLRVNWVGVSDYMIKILFEKKVFILVKIIIVGNVS